MEDWRDLDDRKAGEGTMLGDPRGEGDNLDENLRSKGWREVERWGRLKELCEGRILLPGDENTDPCSEGVSSGMEVDSGLATRRSSCRTDSSEGDSSSTSLVWVAVRFTNDVPLMPLLISSRARSSSSTTTLPNKPSDSSPSANVGGCSKMLSSTIGLLA